MQLSKTTLVGFSVAGFGQNLALNFVNLFVLAYLYAGLGLDSHGIALLTVLLTIAKVWDAVNDLIMGVVVDRTNTRWGRFRPYILGTALPIAVLTTGLFAIPHAPQTTQLIIFFVIYLLWDACYTLSDVPYWAMTNVLTDDDAARSRLVAAARTAGMLALGVVTLGGTQLAKLFSGGDDVTARGWMASAGLVSVVGMALFTLAFFTTRERLAAEPVHVGLWETIKQLVANRPLLLVLASSALGFGRAIIQVGGAVVALIVFGDAGMFSVLGGGLLVGILIATLATPALLVRVSRRAMMIGNGLVSAGAYLVMLLVAPNSLAVVIAAMFVSGLMIGNYSVTLTMMIGDCARAAQARSGVQSDGVAFAGLTFVGKLINALATTAFGAVMSIVGYSDQAPVTESIKSAAWAAVTLVPAVSVAVGVIPLIWYKISQTTPTN